MGPIILQEQEFIPKNLSMTFDPYLKSTGTTNINTISKINIANVISMAAPHYYYKQNATEKRNAFYTTFE